MKRLVAFSILILFAISLSPSTSTPAQAAQDCDPGLESCDPVTEVAPEASTQADDPRRKLPRGHRPNAFTECGLGAIIFNNKYWNLWPLALTGNIIWDLGTTGSTSSSSSPETCTGVKLETAKLILETLPGLEKDIALGRGKHLTALHETMGCDITHQNEINSRLRISYTNVVNDEGYKTKSDIDRASDLYDTVKAVTSSQDSSCKVAL